MRRIIKLTENDLHRIVIESVKQAINEIGDTDEGQYDLGRAAARRYWRSITANNMDDSVRNSDYSDVIASHGALNAPDEETGKQFDYGFEDYLNAIRQKHTSNAR